MIEVVVSTVHTSPYAQLVHLHNLGFQGVADDVLKVLSAGGTEHESLSPSTVAVLKFAQQATSKPGAVTDTDFASLQAAGRSRDEVFELLATIQLFASFKRTTRARVSGIEGSGLGLAICQEIARAHGGRLWATSDGPGEGSRFTLALPLASPA